jgi:hypothetical protein
MNAKSRIDKLAEISVCRGCAFAALAIITFMIGLSWDLALAARIGGMFTLLVSVVLLVKAYLASSRRCVATEVWLMLDETERPPVRLAQPLISAALRQWFLYFAMQAAFVSAALLLISLCLSA